MEIPSVRSHEQLSVFPFLQIASNWTEFIDNLVYLQDNNLSDTFELRLASSDKSFFMSQLLRHGANWDVIVSSRITSTSKIIDVDLPESQEEKPCQECGEPATVYFECSCGTYAWCEKHEDSYIIWDHSDHNCSPECCKRGHTSEEISAEELRKSISPIEVTLNDISESGKTTFVVEVRQKGGENILREFEGLLGQYEITELKGMIDSVSFDRPDISIGEKAVVMPNFLSSRTLILSLIKLGYGFFDEKQLVVEIAGQDYTEYTCLLPWSVTIDEHSQPYNGTRRHCITLNCSELWSFSALKEYRKGLKRR